MAPGPRWSSLLPLAALCAIPLACRTGATARRLSVVSEGTTSRLSLPYAPDLERVVLDEAPDSATAEGAPYEEDVASSARAAPRPELDLRSEDYAGIVEHLSRNAGESEPIEHPFTGP